MNKHSIYSILVTLGLSLTTFNAWGSVETDCDGEHTHAKYVCPAIYQVREELANYKPPEPFVETGSLTFDPENYDYEAPDDIGEGEGGQGIHDWQSGFQQ